MADFVVVETEKVERKIEPFNKIIVLEEGGKLADTPALITIANKTCPKGYKVMVRVMINVDKVEKL